MRKGRRWEEDGNVVGLNGDNHRSGLLGNPRSSVLVTVPGQANRDRLGVVDGLLDEGEEVFVVVSEDVGRDSVNCQVYSCWRLGKRKPGVITDREGLVEAAGESIEMGGIGFCWGVRVSPRKGDSASVVDLGYEPFQEEAVGLGEGGGGYFWEGGGYALGKGVGSGAGSVGDEVS